jgi:hypothetical protein
MPIPTDRGYALVTEQQDGTKNVEVCLGIEPGGQVVDVFATHYSRAVELDPDVEVVRLGGRRVYTADLVEVFLGTDDVVHIARRPHHAGQEVNVERT